MCTLPDLRKRKLSLGRLHIVAKLIAYASVFYSMDTYFIACPDKFSPFSTANFKPESHLSTSALEKKTLRIF
jgi:hypothetical protein